MRRPLLTITVPEALRLHYFWTIFVEDDKGGEPASEGGVEVADRHWARTAACATIRVTKCICLPCSVMAGSEGSDCPQLAIGGAVSMIGIGGKFQCFERI